MKSVRCCRKMCAGLEALMTVSYVKTELLLIQSLGLGEISKCVKGKCPGGIGLELTFLKLNNKIFKDSDGFPMYHI